VSPLTRNVAEQIAGAYRLMASKCRYRPAAPSDGFGHITVPASELDLDAECLDYARQWWQEEDDLKFYVGCCNFSTRPATIFAIEAARSLCSGSDGDELARKLLQMALDSMGERGKPPSARKPRHSAYRTKAGRLWPQHAWITGDGPYATVSFCDNYDPPPGPDDPATTVMLHKTEQDARKALDLIDRLACGGGCTRDHWLIEIPETGGNARALACPPPRAGVPRPPWWAR
jgi:hypothetical protein